MIQENKQMLLDLGRKLITDLTTELNTELGKIELDSSTEIKEEILTNCDIVITKLKRKIAKLDK